MSVRRAGTILGLGLALVGVLQYQSQNAAVFGRWSMPLFAFAAFLAVLWAAVVVRAFRMRNMPMPARAQLVRMIMADAAILVWGIAYSLAAADSPSAGANLLSGNFFGSSVPVAVVLHILALALLFGAVATYLPRLEDRWQTMALPVMAIAFGLLIAEAVVRLRALVAPVTQGFPTYTSALWGRRYVQWNALGFRDAEPTLKADASSPRLLLIGDSYVFGTGVTRIADRFGEQLGARLRTLTGGTWDVVNAGRPDRHTLHEIQTLRCMLRYRPDVVVLVYVFNDIDYLRPVTVREGPSEAPGNLLQRFHPRRLLYANFFIFQELYLRVRAITSARRADDRRERDPYLDEALLERHLRDVGTFVDIARAAGADVFVVPFDIAIAAEERLLARYRRFVAAAGRMGIAATSLEAAFADREYTELSVNALDRHPNVLAHHLAAELVAPVIASHVSRAGSQSRADLADVAAYPVCDP